MVVKSMNIILLLIKFNLGAWEEFVIFLHPL